MKKSIPEHITRLLEKAREPFQAPSEQIPEWRDSADVCTLSDSERHLGHAIRVDRQWIAYDAIHPNPSNEGFRIIGTFQTAGAAKQAIENIVCLSWAWGIGGATLEWPQKSIRSGGQSATS
jgi:hypothetical protein